MTIKCENYLKTKRKIMSKLFLIRHAESEGNVNKSVYYEKHDSEICITENGHAQAQECAATLLSLTNENTIDLHVSSYVRAIQTANYIGEKFIVAGKTVKFHENPLLRERDWGSLRDIVDNRHLKKEAHFNFYYRPDHGESYADAYHRVVTFFTHLRQSRCEGDIVIVSHGEWIRLALMYLDGFGVQHFAEHRKNPKNASIIERNF
jgi:broad specificity phosphatase PhoE